jgi:hypothetical protein
LPFRFAHIFLAFSTIFIIKVEILKIIIRRRKNTKKIIFFCIAV